MPSVSFWGTFNHHSTTSISLKVSSNYFGWSSAGISSWSQGSTYVPLLCIGSSTHLIFMLLWCCLMFFCGTQEEKGFFSFFWIIYNFCLQRRCFKWHPCNPTFTVPMGGALLYAYRIINREKMVSIFLFRRWVSSHLLWKKGIRLQGVQDTRQDLTHAFPV